MESLPPRRLAVILHADVVGSTALVQANETLAHQRIRDAFSRLSSVVHTQGGTTLEVRGDALVAEFPSASDAVEAALSFQADNLAYLETLPDSVKPTVRVGIAVGEVVIADETITGEAVILAQRLEQMAKSGGVCIQATAYATVPKRLPFTYESLGECEVKGFQEPVRAYAVTRTGDGSTVEPVIAIQAESVAVDVPQEPSIAVLPFTNMSGGPEQDYFSDGITEDIITALSRISGLLVVARNSTMVYKDIAVDVKQVGREQGVRYVLEGSVRKSNSRVRVTAQLVDATTGHHVWADRYDRELDDVFAVQDEITQRIVVEMRVQIAEGEQIRLWAGGTKSVEAWEYVARGKRVTNVREINLESRRLAKAALVIDPDFTAATTLLGFTHLLDAFWGWTESKNQSLEDALICGRRALERDEDHPDSRSLLAMCASVQGDHNVAIQLAEESVTLSPSHAENMFALGWVLRGAGEYERAVERLKRAMRLSPIFPPTFLAIIGTCYHLMGHNELAIPNLKEAVRRLPDTVTYRAWLTSSLVDAGLADSKSASKDVLTVKPDFSSRAWADSFSFFRDEAVAKKLLTNLITAGLPE